MNGKAHFSLTLMNDGFPNELSVTVGSKRADNIGTCERCCAASSSKRIGRLEKRSALPAQSLPSYFPGIFRPRSWVIGRLSKKSRDGIYKGVA